MNIENVPWLSELCSSLNYSLAENLNYIIWSPYNDREVVKRMVKKWKLSKKWRIRKKQLKKLKKSPNPMIALIITWVLSIYIKKKYGY